MQIMGNMNNPKLSQIGFKQNDGIKISGSPKEFKQIRKDLLDAGAKKVNMRPLGIQDVDGHQYAVSINGQDTNLDWREQHTRPRNAAELLKTPPYTGLFGLQQNK